MTTDTPPDAPTPPANPDHPWEQRLNESDKAYAAFRVFRDLGPSKRTLAETARQLGKARRGVVEEWAGKHRWVERAKAWDAELERIKREELEEELRREGQRVAGDAKAIQRAAASVAHEVNRRMEADPAFLEKLPVVTLVGLLARSSLAYARGLEVQRLVEGQATQRIEATVKVDPESEAVARALYAELLARGVDVAALERAAAERKATSGTEGDSQ